LCSRGLNGLGFFLLGLFFRRHVFFGLFNFRFLLLGFLNLGLDFFFFRLLNWLGDLFLRLLFFNLWLSRSHLFFRLLNFDWLALLLFGLVRDCVANGGLESCLFGYFHQR
jgi:hypothetical protein